MYMEKLHEQKRAIAVRRLTIGLHVTYLTVVAAPVAYYVVTYGNRFI